MQTTPPSTSDPFSLKSPEPTTTTTTSKSLTIKPDDDDDDDDDLFSDPLRGSRGGPPPKLETKSQSKPTPKSRGLFDDDVSDDDLFSTPAPPKKLAPAQKKRLAGAVPMFGGIDPLAGRAQLKVGGAKTRETEKKSRERSDLFGKNPVNEFRCYEAKIVYFQPEARCSEHSSPLVRSQFLFYYVMVEVKIF